MTWTAADIAASRRQALEPVLRGLGYTLSQLPRGGARVEELRDLVVRGERWFWKSKRLSGNPIDFLQIVEGRTFIEAMELLARHRDAAAESSIDGSGQAAREDPALCFP